MTKTSGRNESGPYSAVALAKLASSGLTGADARKLRFEERTALQVVDLGPGFELRAGLYLPYLDPLTQKPLGDPPFFRLRYLAAASSAFGEDTSVHYNAKGKARKSRRYAQAIRSGVYAYFPPAFIDWGATLPDPEVPLLITEGELKAAKACKEGYACIGLGGVDSFSRRQRGVDLLPELEAIVWEKRAVYIVYDSDAATNPDVQRALLRLAATLGRRGALTYEVRLPDVVPDGKTGLDDFFVAGGNFETLIETLDRQVLTDYTHLFTINDQAALIRELNGVVDQRTQKVMKLETFHTAYATMRFTQRTINAKGEPVEKVVQASSEWVRWPLRAEAGSLTYLPQAVDAPFDRFVPHPSGDVSLSQYNAWSGWGCAPVADECPLFLRLIDHLFTGAEPGAKEWFLRWLAFPIQHPGAKLYSAAVLWSLKTGVGKSLIGEIMGKIYGENYGKIGNKQLRASFNEWAARKQFILGDEITGSEKRELADLLKDMITQTKVEINLKYLNPYTVPDCLNYLFTSNHPDAFLLDEEDRRFFVHEITVPALDDEFYAELTLQLASQRGPDCPGSIMNYLLHLDLAGFGAQERAPMTTSKRNMIEVSRSDLGSWIRALRDDPDGTLRVNGVPSRFDLWTSKDLLVVYDPDGSTRVKAVHIGMELARAGFGQANGGQPVRGADGRLARYYVVRHAERWSSATPAELTAHLKGEDRAAGSTKVTPLKRRKY